MTDDGYLIHYGIKGQHWGVRRFQNEDGSRTQAGLAHDRELYAQQTGKISSGKSTTDSSSRQKGLTDDQKDTLKAIGKAALIAGGVAAAGYVYARNRVAKNVVSGAESVKIGVESTTKNVVSKAETIAKNAASRSKVAVKKASKSAGEKLGNAVEDAKDMATGYLVTRTIDKAADRRLQKKQEKNRHQEEMTRIRRGG